MNATVTAAAPIAVEPHILLVDDDPIWTELLCVALQSAGCHTLTAANADEALAVVATSRPALAVLDVRMPGISGIELGTLLRDEFGVPFMIMSADDGAASVQQATAVGAIAYLVKSADPGKCIPTVRAALARADEFRRLRESEAQLSTALQHAREISTAVGLLMERLRLDRNAAFEVLRDDARMQGRRIADVAEELLRCAERLSMAGARLPGNRRRS